MTTFAPSAASRIAIACPMPEDAPVTMATLPPSRFGTANLRAALMSVGELGSWLAAGVEEGAELIAHWTAVTAVGMRGGLGRILSASLRTLAQAVRMRPQPCGSTVDGSARSAPTRTLPPWGPARRRPAAQPAREESLQRTSRKAP